MKFINEYNYYLSPTQAALKVCLIIEEARCVVEKHDDEEMTLSLSELSLETASCFVDMLRPIDFEAKVLVAKLNMLHDANNVKKTLAVAAMAELADTWFDKPEFDKFIRKFEFVEPEHKKGPFDDVKEVSMEELEKPCMEAVEVTSDIKPTVSNNEDDEDPYI